MVAGPVEGKGVGQKKQHDADVLPGTPTYGELGLPNSNDPSWFGLVAPAGTPTALVNRVQQAVVKSLQEPAVRTKLTAQGLFASGTTPAEFDAQIKREIAKMQRIAQFAKTSIE